MKPADADVETGRMGGPVYVLFGAILLHLAATALVGVCGHLSVDEVGYHWMTKSVADGRPWTIDNGYEETPSPALEVMTASTVKACNGHLHGKYPRGFPLLAAPLYRVMGLRALFLLNALAFAVVLILTWRLACRYLDPAWSLVACGILALATYSWEYSQGAWPHMTALAFALGGILLGLGIPEEPRRGRGAVRALMAGLLMGIALWVRLDAVLLLGAVALIVLWARPVRLAEAALLGVGAAPALLALALDNHFKYGSWSPFFYGSGVVNMRWSSPLLTGVAILAVAMAMRALSHRFPPRVSRSVFVLTVIAAAVALVVVRGPARQAVKWVRNTHAILADMGSLHGGRLEPAMARTASGGVVYIGRLKKALLQSAPYLTLLVALALRRSRAPRGKPVWPLFVPVAVLVLAYGPTAWHGGLCLNQRYLLPIFPFTSVLVTLVLRDLWEAEGHAQRRAMVLACLLALAVVVISCAWLFLARRGLHENIVTGLPALLSLLVGAGGALFGLGAVQKSRALRLSAMAVIGAALGWSIAVAFFYDFRGTAAQRRLNRTISTRVERELPAGSLVFIPFIDAFATLIDRDMMIANPWQDRFETFHRLTAHYRGLGVPVYLVTISDQFEMLKGVGILDDVGVKPVVRIGTLQVHEIDARHESRLAPEDHDAGAETSNHGILTE
ncbi:MAG: hypothetical protein JXB04_11240 [Kiritimatiellae bacterium]|nr:hypothetical protein [Kiritimatiellia bacterium]